jgi:hypothetical protein
MGMSRDLIINLILPYHSDRVITMPLDEEVRKLLEQFEAEGIPSASSLPVPEARKLNNAMARRLSGPPVSVAMVQIGGLSR